MALVAARSSRAVSKAQAEVDRLEQALTRWQSDAALKRAALDELEAGAGDAVLADETGTVARQLAVDAQELRFGIDGAERAADAAQRQLRPARWTLALAEAAQLREQAATIRGEAEKRQARVDELLAALVDYEGGDWRPWQPSAADVIQAGAAGIPVASRRTPPMFEQARQLDAQAAAIEERVAGDRRQAAVLVPTAQIVWRPSHSNTQCSARVSCSVNDGTGAAAFEVRRNGAAVAAVTLPDDSGRRGWGTAVSGLRGDVVEVRSAGRVLASLTFARDTDAQTVVAGPVTVP